MTIEEAEEQVEYIRSLADDDEAAAGAEAEFRDAVLQAIADGRASSPRDLAAVALKTNALHFSRWHA